ncbi:MAG: aminoacyl-tRNA hydrolase [Candidatus Nealsonbacteria bacterium]|nr:aminoacyl-tRNA hydrolase [Candidatus Nealsonbacteria bacterium]
MILVIGLGNPGKKYENTRHNAGSRMIDELKILNLEDVLAEKTGSFMNRSGPAVRRLLQKTKLKIPNLLVMHDDIDLPLGKIKISRNSGSAGHKGVQSIIDSLGSKNFLRIRIGICPASGKPKEPPRFVLQKFTKDEEKAFKEVVEKTIEAIKCLLSEGVEKAMSLYNK